MTDPATRERAALDILNRLRSGGALAQQPSTLAAIRAAAGRSPPDRVPVAVYGRLRRLPAAERTN
jgi:hypothetical protein